MTDLPQTRQQDMPTETPNLSIRITMLLLASLTIMSGALIATSLPGIEARFANHENVVMLSRLVLTLPGLFVAIGAPFAGAIADRIGSGANRCFWCRFCSMEPPVHRACLPTACLAF
ncbi:hypothetical protein [Thalassospira sp.]|uniref:hypothetical protein n=1 Tax=Thalassospira sp. TaxID=1912094 RepID=UPI0025F3B89C|nr:hypothetical protein [Thalassospira sp.]